MPERSTLRMPISESSSQCPYRRSGRRFRHLQAEESGPVALVPRLFDAIEGARLIPACKCAVAGEAGLTRRTISMQAEALAP
jgi:hypothetical protein